jgi:hypothetical protein
VELLQHEVEAQQEQLLQDEIPLDAAVSDKVIVSSISISSTSPKSSSNSFTALSSFLWFIFILPFIF